MSKTRSTKAYYADHLLLPYIKLKKKRGLELVSLPHFLKIFEEKYFSCFILLTQQISLPDCIYFLRY